MKTRLFLVAAAFIGANLLAVPTLANHTHHTRYHKRHHESTSHRVNRYLDHSSKNINHWFKGTSKKINHDANKTSKDVNHTFQGH